MPSFDVVCKLDLQEVDNAVNQTLREVGQRFDFKGSNSEVRREEHTLHLKSADEFRVKALAEILREKLGKRQVPVKALESKPIESALGGTAKQQILLQQGISSEKAKEIVKMIKDAKLKVQASIQSDQVRVTGKKRDDLQTVITLLRDKDLGIAMQYVNFRD
jgi:cyclic-di-GMP-binding protein